MSARIENLIGLATLQGLPIEGYRRFGVPPGGAFDQESFLLGNALLGNDPGSLAIELSNAAIAISFSMPTRVAITGAPCEGANSAFDVAAGRKLELSAPSTGLRTYVCTSGGWLPEGVDSALARAGRRLGAGDVLLHREVEPSGETKRLALPPTSVDGLPVIRTMKGPQPLIDIADLKGLQVSNDSDRSGIRLNGLAAQPVPELPSEPACVGAIQLTPSGQFIVIGPDGPTIGGYPKVAVVCAADLDRIAQLRPGQHVAFVGIDRESARQVAEERNAGIARTVAQIKIRS